jgi:hypothetical protein
LVVRSFVPQITILDGARHHHPACPSTQRALAEVLNAVYEQDFVGFSYGFRPGRSQHHALDALAVGIERRRVRWVLDADIRKAPDNRHEGRE